MIYSYDTRVGFDKLGPDGRADIGSILDYLNECCFFHGQDVGRGIYDTLAYDRTWMTISWQVVVDRYPNAFERLKVSTMGVGCDRLYAHRNHFITDESGEMIAKSFSLWTWTNMKTGHPANLQEEQDAYLDFQPETERLEMDYAPRKIRLPKEGFAPLDPIPVTGRFLDANGHVNNSRFLDVAEEAAGRKFYPQQIRIEYKAQAFVGDVITTEICEEPDRDFYVLKNQNGDVCCSMELLK